ncbi:MAG: hypothetical protein IPQ19_04450 [Bacteroidetes bacterium]|nr:hypothetical protein [Bacteroidota bacterium]
MSDTIYSQHHFMFPFRWDILPAKFKLQSIKENIAFDERTDLNDTLFNNLANWTHKSFELQNEFGDIDHIKYNEFTYFHDFVQKAVFDFEYPWKKINKS